MTDVDNTNDDAVSAAIPSSTSQEDKKSVRLLKQVGFTAWRATAEVSLGAETLTQLDTYLIDKLDWQSLTPFEFPPTVDSFPLNKSFFVQRAREQYGISSTEVRERLANTLSFLASRVIFAAASMVKALDRNRIMPAHVDAAWTLVESIFGNVSVVTAASSVAVAASSSSSSSSATSVVVAKKTKSTSAGEDGKPAAVKDETKRPRTKMTNSPRAPAAKTKTTATPEPKPAAPKEAAAPKKRPVTDKKVVIERPVKKAKVVSVGGD